MTRGHAAAAASFYPSPKVRPSSNCLSVDCNLKTVCMIFRLFKHHPHERSFSRRMFFGLFYSSVLSLIQQMLRWVIKASGNIRYLNSAFTPMADLFQVKLGASCWPVFHKLLNDVNVSSSTVEKKPILHLHRFTLRAQVERQSQEIS